MEDNPVIGAGTDGDPLVAMHRWLCDAPSRRPTRCCADGASCDGHRRNVMRADFGTMGVGYAYNPESRYGHYWTQDFGGVGGGGAASPALVDGAHVFVGGSVRFVANVQATLAPRRVVLVVAGVRAPMAPDLGTAMRGTWAATRPRGDTCRSYAFELTDAAGAIYRVPARGFYRTAGEGRCREDWVPDASGR